MQKASNPNYELAIKEIGEKLKNHLDSSLLLDQKTLRNEKLAVCKKYNLTKIPKNSEILSSLDTSVAERLEYLLRRKSVRTRSGIAVITVITKPFSCPHGTCIYCPGGVRFGTPQSYTRNSPAAAFGLERNYDPALQVRDYILNLKNNGHDVSKIELIVLGGTVLAMPQDYQIDFIKRCYETLNGKSAKDIAQAIKDNENALHRCVGLTIETKPDWCKEYHIDMLLSYGATRVEIGVQSLREDILRFVNRGHTLEDTVQAFRIAKDSSFKVVAHMMPRLPLATPETDIDDLMSLIDDPKYRPDMLKIYPTLVVEGTALYNLYKIGKYAPYSEEELIDILCRFKSKVPPWLRIMRIQREIPKEEIVEGTKAGNLRQLIKMRMMERGIRCRCIRCREIGHKLASGEIDVIPRVEEAKLKRIDYEASEGREIFLSFEDTKTDSLFGFLRLRIPSGKEHRPEIKGSETSLVRELHIFGQVVPISKQPEAREQAQHKGLGKSLLAEAERISRDEFGLKKQLVIAATGTKEYYRRQGYKDDGPYVSKQL
ncbi:MAG: tRNA uridine(34) 5-carboxymethylaminomethyl modification radical SAM/GNAT enzyme Elp3 [Conexivisphaerales archaeon]